MSAILACGTERLDLLSENFNIISYRLGINNTPALRSILSIACGDTSEISHLKDKKNNFFHIRDSNLLEALMFLIDEGRKMRDEHTRFDIKDSTFACQTLYEALKKVFGMKTVKTRLDTEGKSADDLSEHVDNQDSDNSLSYAGVQDFDLNDLLDTNDPLLANIEVLVNSCWNDGKALYILSDKILKHSKNEPGELNQIWEMFPDKGKAILVKSLKRIYNEALDSMAVMDSIMEKKIKANVEYIRALEIGDDMDITYADKEEEEVISKLRDNDQQKACKVGCTFNITGFREFNQMFYLCETCEAITKEDVIVCLCCAEFCHAGHRMMKGKKGKHSRVVCSCGSNTFPDCPLSDENPLINIQGRDQISETK